MPTFLFPMRKLKTSELNRLSVNEFKDKPKHKVIVVLDNVRSLYNVGSIFRTSDAFSIESIYLCGITGTPPHKEIRKTAIGAEQSVDWKYFESTQQAVDLLKLNNYQLVAIEQTSASIPLEKETIVQQPIALVFGNEVNGVGLDIIKQCMLCVEIPQFGTKHSFNVSVSVALVLWELLR